MLMPIPTRLRIPQLELFRPASITPTMPPDVYRTTVQLLARLLREVARPNRERQEVGHE
jgi:hypothetical protein